LFDTSDNPYFINLACFFIFLLWLEITTSPTMIEINHMTTGIIIVVAPNNAISVSIIPHVGLEYISPNGPMRKLVVVAHSLYKSGEVYDKELYKVSTGIQSE